MSKWVLVSLLFVSCNCRATEKKPLFDVKCYSGDRLVLKEEVRSIDVHEDGPVIRMFKVDGKFILTTADCIITEIKKK